MSQLFITQAGALAFQSAGIPGWTLLHMDLITAGPVTPGRLAVIADFTLATYTGYAQASVTLTGGWVEGAAGKVYMVTGASRFGGPSAGPGVDVIGFVLQDATTHAVWAWGTFDAPVALQAPTDLCEVLLQIFEDESSNVVVVS